MASYYIVPGLAVGVMLGTAVALRFIPAGVPSPSAAVIPPEWAPRAVAVVPIAPSARLVDWFIAHPTERHARIAECMNDVGHAQTDADCLNADEANRKAGYADASAQLERGM